MSGRLPKSHVEPFSLSDLVKISEVRCHNPDEPELKKIFTTKTQRLEENLYNPLLCLRVSPEACFACGNFWHGSKY